jgi:type I restriction enzyme, S subunit
MELMTKYKQTEIGLIPSDWNIEPLRTLIDQNRHIRYGVVQPGNYTTNGCLMLRSQDYSTGWRNTDNMHRVNQQVETLYKGTKLKPKDLVITIVGAGIAQIVVVPDWLEGTLLSRSTARIAIDPNRAFNAFVYSYLRSSGGRAQVLFGIKEGAQPVVSANDIGNCLIPLPPTLNEQKAIATALSDVDELIANLDKLIVKKKAIKQGAMQQLLMPKSNWKTKTLKEVSTFRRGSFPQPYGLDKWYDDISGMPFVQVVDVAKNRKLKPETKQKISAEGAKMSVFVKKGSVILTIQGSIGRICITQYDSYVDRTLLIFESFLEEFNKFFFMTIVHQKFDIEKENAPGGIIKTITKEALSSFEISYPDIKEQNKIAEILFDMDEQIEALEAKKVKYQDIKQGMMQELLTGKTRLV